MTLVKAWFLDSCVDMYVEEMVDCCDLKVAGIEYDYFGNATVTFECQDEDDVETVKYYERKAARNHH